MTALIVIVVFVFCLAALAVVMAKLWGDEDD